MANPLHLDMLARGFSAWNDWRTANLSVIPDLIEADLSGRNLSRFDLSDAHLEFASLRHAKLIDANLIGSRLIQADLADADLTDADLTLADVSGATLMSSNLTRANLNGLKWRPGKKAMRGKFRGIRGLDACYGNALFKRDAMDQDFLDTLEAHWLGTWRYYLFWSWGFFLDYGRSLSRVALIGLSTIVAYAVVFSSIAGLIVDDGPSKSVIDPLYFSIVTFTTLGYGDVLPAGSVGKIIAGSEVIVGYVTLGLLLSVLANKLARRS